MKNTKLLILLTTILFACGGYVGMEDLIPIEDSLDYKKILGTYVFKPNGQQAARLEIDSNEVITLRITEDSLVNFNSELFKGKYYIDKMILMLNSFPKEPYSSTWTYYCNSTGPNSLRLDQPLQTLNNFDYRIERSPSNDTIHITGYIADPKYEIYRIIDFKKIK